MIIMKYIVIALLLVLAGCQNDIQNDYSATVIEGSTSEFEASKEVFKANALLFDTEKGSLKRGDGKSTYSDLPYINPGIVSGTYTPSASGVAYATNVVFNECTYTKVGDNVTINGSFSISMNSYTDRANFQINTPFPGSIDNVSGIINGIYISTNSQAFGQVQKQGNSNSPYFLMKSGNSGVQHVFFTLSYTITGG